MNRATTCPNHYRCLQNYSVPWYTSKDVILAYLLVYGLWSVCKRVKDVSNGFEAILSGLCPSTRRDDAGHNGLQVKLWCAYVKAKAGRNGLWLGPLEKGMSNQRPCPKSDTRIVCWKLFLASFGELCNQTRRYQCESITKTPNTILHLCSRLTYVGWHFDSWVCQLRGGKLCSGFGP